MISAPASRLPVQAVALLVMFRFVETGRLALLILVGVLCGIGWMLKQSLGVLFLAGIALSMLLVRRDGDRAGRFAVALGTLGAAFAAVVALTLAWLVAAGGLLARGPPPRRFFPRGLRDLLPPPCAP